jgi:hypothetical protein
MLYHTSLLTGVAAGKQPVPVLELGAGTPVEAVAPRLVVVIGVQLVPTVRAVAVAQLSLPGGTLVVLNKAVATGEVVLPAQLPVMVTV